MTRKQLLFLSLLTLLFISSGIKSQTFSCKVDKDVFTGKVNNALLTNVGEIKYVQIPVVNNNKLMYLYLKESKLSEETPITLVYKEHNFETGETPDAELVWAPDGADSPQWHSTKGEAVVTYFNSEERIVSGTFNFIVEKASYSSRPDRKKQTSSISEGIFEDIKFNVMNNN